MHAACIHNLDLRSETVTIGLISKIVIIGFGNIAQALLPLLRKQYAGPIIIIEKSVDIDRIAIARKFDADLRECEVTQNNALTVISLIIEENAFLLNLAVSVSSIALIDIAQSKNSYYLDTCIEPWEYESEGAGITTSNYRLRQELLDHRQHNTSKNATTAIVAHGANPGFVSILLKKALLDMATSVGIPSDPTTKEEWAYLAQNLDIRVIQISERDTQVSYLPRMDGEFVCTWSVDGFITEALQPAELGWGTHEGTPPEGALSHEYGSKCSIELAVAGHEVRVKSWTPNALDFNGYLVTHNESLSIADYLTVKNSNTVLYRPTCYYAYHPCDEAASSLRLLKDGNEKSVKSKRILKEDVVSGIDELGVFLISGTHGAYWLGSNLSIGRARKIAEHNNATSLQVVSSIIAAMKWALLNPNRGVLESDELDWKFLYQETKYFWEPIVSSHVSWKPVRGETSHQLNDYLTTVSESSKNYPPKFEEA